MPKMLDWLHGMVPVSWRGVGGVPALFASIVVERVSAYSREEAAVCKMCRYCTVCICVTVSVREGENA
jgi:hypothetical protein